MIAWCDKRLSCNNTATYSENKNVELTYGIRVSSTADEAFDARDYVPTESRSRTAGAKAG